MTAKIKKDKFDNIRDKTYRIVIEGIRLSKSKKDIGLCSQKCASCLSAYARENVDKKDFGSGFDSDEDICMTTARDILADKLGWEVR